MTMQTHSNFIAGKWVPPETGSYYSTHNPAHPAQALGEFPCSGRPDVEAAASAAKQAFPAWAKTPGPQRGALLFRFAQLLEESKNELARIITLEQGKALGESAGEVSRAAVEARYMAGEASRPIGQTFPSERAGFSCHTVAEPLGVVAAISPWNFPVVTPVRKIAPALAFGNTVVGCIPDAVAGQGGFSRWSREPGDRPGFGDRRHPGGRPERTRHHFHGFHQHRSACCRRRCPPLRQPAA